MCTVCRLMLLKKEFSNRPIWEKREFLCRPMSVCMSMCPSKHARMHACMHASHSHTHLVRFTRSVAEIITSPCSNVKIMMRNYELMKL